MKIIFYVLSVAAATFAILALLRGIEEYIAGNGFQIVQFGIAIVGILPAGIWVKRARSM